MIVLYLGPDSLLPLGSILAAVAGFILLFWNRITGLFRRPGRAQEDDLGPTPPAEGESPVPDEREGR